MQFFLGVALVYVGVPLFRHYSGVFRISVFLVLSYAIKKWYLISWRYCTFVPPFFFVLVILVQNFMLIKNHRETGAIALSYPPIVIDDSHEKAGLKALP